jgi:hypothetical protein
MKGLKFKNYKNKNLFREALEYAAMGNKGVQLAMQESQRKGIPTVFGIMDKVFYRMPDGTITTKNPFKKNN